MIYGVLKQGTLKLGGIVMLLDAIALFLLYAILLMRPPARHHGYLTLRRWTRYRLSLHFGKGRWYCNAHSRGVESPDSSFAACMTRSKHILRTTWCLWLRWCQENTLWTKGPAVQLCHDKLILLGILRVSRFSKFIVVLDIAIEDECCWTGFWGRLLDLTLIVRACLKRIDSWHNDFLWHCLILILTISSIMLFVLATFLSGFWLCGWIYWAIVQSVSDIVYPLREATDRLWIEESVPWIIKSSFESES